MVNPTIEPRFDSRGLPEGYDPHKFYEYHIAKNSEAAEGLELFVYRLMPWAMIKSIAFAIDPLSGFKVSTGVVTKANRTRKRGVDTVLMVRTLRFRRISTHSGSVPNWENHPGQWGPLRADPDTVTTSSGNQGNQPVILDKIIDTTNRTRLINSDVGELDRFSSKIRCPGRTIRYGSRRYIFKTRIPPSMNEIAIDGEYNSYSIEGPAATLPLTTYNNLVTSEHSIASALMASKVLGIYKGILPTARNYSFFRNLVELRDLPRGILQLRETLRNLVSLERSLKVPSKLVGKIRNLKTSIDDIPKEYLSYHFGWKQTVSDVNDLLKSPSRISKQINFLLKRDGKDTTYRSSRKYATASTGVSGFSHDVLTGEYSPSIQSRIERETELRMVVNANFRFPDVNTPAFIEHTYLDKLGIYPRATDIYNLVPWTWLIDWFTGLGNYVEIIDNINHDRSLINWGFLTAIVDGRLVTDFSSKSDFHDTGQYDSNPGYDNVTTTTNAHSATLDFTLQLRKDIANVLSVHKTSDATTLSTYQGSILAAIIQQAGKLRSSPAFR